jgi:hypothetical protein
MLSDDYLFRMFSQAAAVFARIIGLKKSGDYIGALREIDQNLEQLLGLNTKLIRLLDDESLYRNLSIHEQLNMERLGIIADLFKEEGEINKILGKKPESENAYGRSLSFYLLMELNNDPSHPMDVSQKISEIIQNIKYDNVPSKTLFDLFCCFENEEKYAKADEILELLSARPDAKTDARRERKLFYKRLLENESIELTAHGMNRKYIQDKEKELE